MPRRKGPIDPGGLGDLPDLVVPAGIDPFVRDFRAEVPPPPPPDPEPTDREAARLRELLSEIAKRRCEALKLYEPLPSQDAFHRDRTRIRLLRGSNRAGKTLCAAVEVARAVTAQDPHGKYPREDGRLIAVGEDYDAVGQVMFRKLYHAGAFRMVRDPMTRRWRAFRPDYPWDAAHADLARPAPPLIPRRMIKDISWFKKSAGIPDKVKLVTGWEMNFFSSKSEPPTGVDIDLAWLDEEIVNERWIAELRARTLDRMGTIFWSATPQVGTQQLYDLHQDAEADALAERPRVREFFVSLHDNPHITEQAKADFIAGLSDEEREVRVEGKFAINSLRVYPDLMLAGVHGLDDFPVPASWTRWVAVDPGIQVCAALFLAVPPPGASHRGVPLGGRWVCYDELYLKQATAERFGLAMRERGKNQQFYAFLIDLHAGRIPEVGTGRTTERQYSDALKRFKVRSVRTRHRFAWGSDDVDAGIQAVRSALRLKEDGLPQLLFFRGLKNFQWEAERYLLKRMGNYVTDKPVQKNNHLLDCLRYLVMAQPRHVRLKGGVERPRGVLAALEAKRRRERERRLEEGGLPPGIRLG